jgi:hypothetical protein
LDYLPLLTGTVWLSDSPSVFGLDDNQSKVFATDRITNQWGFITAQVPGCQTTRHLLNKMTIYWGRISGAGTSSTFSPYVGASSFA